MKVKELIEELKLCRSPDAEVTGWAELTMGNSTTLVLLPISEVRTEFEPVRLTLTRLDLRVEVAVDD